MYIIEKTYIHTYIYITSTKMQVPFRSNSFKNENKQDIGKTHGVADLK